ncbi:MAG: hypothetical protein Q8P18_21315 [Pseudomonadota bacterium]|nr:hypothetical protein [Pseudomonadota bacterium]
MLVVTAFRGRAPDDEGKVTSTTPPPELARQVVRYFWLELYKQFNLELAETGAVAKKVTRTAKPKAKSTGTPKGASPADLADKGDAGDEGEPLPG